MDEHIDWDTVTLTVESIDAVKRRVLQAARSLKPQSGPRISFASPELLLKAVTPARMNLIGMLNAAGEPISLRELARRVGRDAAGVHADVAVLLNAGLIDRDEGTMRLSCRFRRVHVDFTVEPAAA